MAPNFHASGPLGLALLSCLALCQCQVGTSITAQHTDVAGLGPRHVLTLIGTADSPGSFVNLESTLDRSFSAWPRFENHCQRVSDREELRAHIFGAAATFGPLDALIFAFHGHANKFRLGPRQSLHQRHLDVAFRDIESCLKPDASVILYACLTGEGEDNLAQDLAKVLRRRVSAPTHYWLMQTAVPIGQRIPELELTPEGRVAVAEDRFALYYKARLESGRDRHLIAPTTMHALCLADGFERKPSRFRPLFRHYRP